MMRNAVLLCSLAISLLGACRITTEEPLTGEEPGEDLEPIEDSGELDTIDVTSFDLVDLDILEVTDIVVQDANDPIEEPDLLEEDPVEEPDLLEEDPVEDRITWVGQVSGIFRNRCVSCHRWASSYSQVAPRCENGDMQYYIEIGHFISGQERQTVLTWLDQGWPEE